MPTLTISGNVRNKIWGAKSNWFIFPVLFFLFGLAIKLYFWSKTIMPDCLHCPCKGVGFFYLCTYGPWSLYLSLFAEHFIKIVHRGELHLLSLMGHVDCGLSIFSWWSLLALVVLMYDNIMYDNIRSTSYEVEGTLVSAVPRTSCYMWLGLSLPSHVGNRCGCASV